MSSCEINTMSNTEIGIDFTEIHGYIRMAGVFRLSKVSPNPKVGGTGEKNNPILKKNLL